MTQEITKEERAKIAAILTDILSIEDNQFKFALNVMETITRTMQQVAKERELPRPAVVKVYYPHSIKATIVETDSESELDVIFEKEKNDEEGNLLNEQWEPLEEDDKTKEALKKIVLHNSALKPDEVVYITTDKEVEKVLKQIEDETIAAINRNI